jgi:hypothetical protein
MMDILNRLKEKRGADQSKIVQDTFDNVVEKINK